MIKVLNIISDSNIGGAGRCLLNYLKYYDKDTFRIKVVVPKNSLLIPLIKELNIKVIEVDGIADKSFDIKAIEKLKKIIVKENPHIVHTHSALSGRIASKLAGKKIIYTRHSVFPVSKSIAKGIGKLANKVVNEFLADKIIAVAEAAKDNLTDSGISEKKIKVILNGVEPLTKISDEEILKLKKELNIKETDFVLGILARLNEVKGHTYLIDAINKLKNLGYHNLKLLIIGTGEIEEELKKKVKKLNLEDTIIFTGFIDNVHEILSIIDLQVNASFGTEATSLALLEGMSLKIPAVVTNYGGNPGVITDGENGLIVKTKDSEDLANGILKIIEDNNLRLYMQQRALEIFNEKFTVKTYCKNIEDLYKSVLKNRKEV